MSKLSKFELAKRLDCLQTQMTQQEVNYRTYTFEELLNEQGYFVYTNVGTSMMPLLRQQKDLIEIRRKDRPIKKYDVALYKRNGKYVLHRCMSANSTGYVFAGDHNTLKEYDVTEDMLIGIMNRVVRDGKDINLSSFSYRLYSHLWVDFFPIKVILLESKRFFQRVSRITPVKLKNYFNWKIIKVIDLFNDYCIAGQDLIKSGKDTAGNCLQYRPVNYLVLSEILSHVELTAEDKFLDIGCGKGRTLAYLLSKHCPCEVYGVEENKIFADKCAEWTNKYHNVHVICGDILAINYNQFTILHLEHSFSGQESLEFIDLLEKQMQHPITMVYPFDQYSQSIFEGRPGWTLQYREEFFKIYGLQVVGDVRRFSIWEYDPTRKEAGDEN